MYIIEVFKVIIIKLSDKFKIKFKKNYSEDNLQNKIFKALVDIFKKEEDISTNVGFKLRNGLIYYLDKEG